MTFQDLDPRRVRPAASPGVRGPDRHGASSPGEVILAVCEGFARAFPGQLGVLVEALSRAGVRTCVHERVDGRFPDGDLRVGLPGAAAGRHVLILQCPTADPAGLDAALVSVFATAYTYREYGAVGVTAFMPHLPYSRHDRDIPEHRRAALAGMVAALSGACGLDHLISLASGRDELLSALFDATRLTLLSTEALQLDMLAAVARTDTVLVAPDHGALRPARRIAGRLRLPLVGAAKTRLDADSVVLSFDAESLPEDARHFVILDDLITSGATIEAAAKAVLEHRPQATVDAVATHFRPTPEGRRRIRRLTARGTVRGIRTTDSTGWRPSEPAITSMAVLPRVADAIATASLEDVVPRPHGAAGDPVLAVSVVCLDQSRIGSQIRRLRALGVRRLHIDLAEPRFGGELGLPLGIISDLRRSVDLPLDVHVMLDDPGPAVAEAAARGADAISVHRHSLDADLSRTLRALADKDVEIGIAVEPGERLDADLARRLGARRVVVMSVVPGGAGRPFQPSALRTLAAAKQLRDAGVIERIEVDGAVSAETAPLMVSGGADQLVLGSRMLPDRQVCAARIAGLWRSLGATDTGLEC